MNGAAASGSDSAWRGSGDARERAAQLQRGELEAAAGPEQRRCPSRARGADRREHRGARRGTGCRARSRAPSCSGQRAARRSACQLARQAALAQPRPGPRRARGGWRSSGSWSPRTRMRALMPVVTRGRARTGHARPRALERDVPGDAAARHRAARGPGTPASPAPTTRNVPSGRDRHRRRRRGSSAAPVTVGRRSRTARRVRRRRSRSSASRAAAARGRARRTCAPGGLVVVGREAPVLDAADALADQAPGHHARRAVGVLVDAAMPQRAPADAADRRSTRGPAAGRPGACRDLGAAVAAGERRAVVAREDLGPDREPAADDQERRGPRRAPGRGSAASRRARAAPGGRARALRAPATRNCSYSSCVERRSGGMSLTSASPRRT